MAATEPTTTADRQPALRFDHLSIDLGGVSILDAVSATVPAGGCTCIVGPNGAGKTSLLLAFLGQIPYRGTIDAPPARIGYVPQRLQFDRGMPLSVGEFLVMGVQRAPLWLGIGQRHADRAAELLRSVGAGHLARRRLGTLSGGELQRVLLALALQQRPELLLLDEPAAGVDVRGGRLFCELLEELRHRLGFSQVMVTHDLGMVLHHATHTILLNRRVIAEGPPRQVLTPDNLTTAYGLHMGGQGGPVPGGVCDCHCRPERRRETDA